MYYRYDANGNVLEERRGGHAPGSGARGEIWESGGIYSTDYGFGITLNDTSTQPADQSRS